MKDNQTIDLGNRTLICLHTPGHSPGHLCIYEEERGYLYTGDLAYKGTLFAFYPTTDPFLFVKSLEKISQIEHITRVLPGHNELDLNQAFIHRLSNAGQELLNKGLARHGTGIHEYKDVKFYF